jgi:hypothetical protein
MAGITLSSAGPVFGDPGFGIRASGGRANFGIYNMEFGYCYSGHIDAEEGANVGIGSNTSSQFVNISGGGAAHLNAGNNGIVILNAPTPECAPPVFITYFCNAVAGGAIDGAFAVQNNPGAVGGSKFIASLNGTASLTWLRGAASMAASNSVTTFNWVPTLESRPC